MNAYTPGPWAYRPQEHDDWGIVRMAGKDEDGFQRVICQANYVADPTELCEHRANGTDPAAADARLIAAAPELLEALRECNDILTRLTSGNPDPSGADIIAHYEACVKAELVSRKAIAKAVQS